MLSESWLWISVNLIFNSLFELLCDSFCLLSSGSGTIIISFLLSLSMLLISFNASDDLIFTSCSQFFASFPDLKRSCVLPNLEIYMDSNKFRQYNDKMEGEV